ncbi:HAD family hydrolase [Leptolyngbya sp. NIES-2104]|uniref:HAD family hydrolase n=1 Tax=Leptolyngbya sp. NIES-2104 TaxID=1552121 RepID=UPI0006ECA928|nr:HAD-IA family hydrolase [Leptolyngbya sp. NIES-2104]GAP98342.1 haloacid dehalogenase/epoxide hydrolase family [Leptolyngbya sp. NIES-2104]
MVTIVCNGVQFENIEAVIFDKDGTLANSHQYLWHLAEKRAELIDAIVPGLKSKILATFECGNPAGLMAIGTREDDEIAIASLLNRADARSIVQSAFQQADQQLPRKATLTPLYPEIVELLQSLNSLKLGILSSDIEPNIRDFLEEYQLSAYFQGMIGAQPGISKPNPKLLFLICKVLNVEPEAALVIGDTIADTTLTPRSIGVTWGGNTIAQLIGAGAIAHYPSDIRLSHT